MVITIKVVGNVQTQASEADFSDITVSVDIEVFNDLVSIGTKTISVTRNRNTQGFYNYCLKELKEEALRFKAYCIKKQLLSNVFKNTAVDLQAMV